MIKTIGKYCNWIKSAPLKVHLVLTLSAMALILLLHFVLPEWLNAYFVIGVCLFYFIPARVLIVGERAARTKRAARTNGKKVD